MRTRLLLIAVLSCVSASGAAVSSSKLYSDLDRYLRSLKSLEVQYAVEGTQVEGGVLSGRLIWVRPDRFYHDTPEWTLCEIGKEQWRYLKTQNTLIREEVSRQERWTPESVIFDLKRSFRPDTAEELGDGTRVLRMLARDANAPGNVTLEFPPESRVPNQIRFELVDGTVTDYRIAEWNENISADSELFIPPDVPAENVIDFRGVREDTR